MKLKFSFLVFLISLTLFSLKAQTIDLWGMTSEGGTSNLGTVFSIDTDGNHTIKHKFQDEDMGRGSYSNQLCEASNGKLYGLASSGGLNNGGVLFEYDFTDNTYTKKIDFNNETGINPYRSSLIQAANAWLYGTINGYNSSSIFKFDITTNAYHKIWFQGYSPRGTLFEASDGNLYGIANKLDGYHDVLFRFNLQTEIFTEVHEFIEGESEIYPNTDGLVESSDGKLYGLIRNGGVNDCGILYEYNIQSDTLIYKSSFEETTTGKRPIGKLILSDHQTLYGLTSFKGLNDKGLVFEFDFINNLFSVIHNFEVEDGANFESGNSLVLYNNKLVGEMLSNGIYEIDLNDNSFSIKHNFDGLMDGRYPEGSLVLASNGDFFGMTNNGGEYDGGTIFSYNSNTENYSKKIDLHRNINGKKPFGGLIQASNGKVYGLTPHGGYDDSGVLFEYDNTSGEYTKKLNIFLEKEGPANRPYGQRPWGTLFEASNHKLYGTTEDGGSYDMTGRGSILNYDIENDTISIDHFFTNQEGIRPLGNLIETEDGKLWGMTNNGGSFYQDDYESPGYGVLFEYDFMTGVYTKKADLRSNPYGSLLHASNNRLYGMTSKGGNNGGGQLFEYNIEEEQYSEIYNFNSNTGKNPKGSLIQAANQKLYGLTIYGGDNNLGVIFEYDIELDEYTKIHDFDGINGSEPMGSLLQASNGKLYGMTSEGGTHDDGVVFEFDITDNEFVKIFDFDSINGKRPLYSALIEFNPVIGIEELSEAQIIKVFPNPTRGLVFVQAIGLQEIQIYSISGQLVKTINTNNEFMSFSLKEKGVYMIRVSTKSSVTNHKVVVE